MHNKFISRLRTHSTVYMKDIFLTPKRETIIHQPFKHIFSRILLYFKSLTFIHFFVICCVHCTFIHTLCSMYTIFLLLLFIQFAPIQSNSTIWAWRKVVSNNRHPSLRIVTMYEPISHRNMCNMILFSLF